MILKRFLVFGLALLTFSCAQRTETVVSKVDTYYDLAGLLDKQVHYLFQQNATLEKTVGAGDKSEVLRMEPDTAVWKEELKLFYNADINKQGLVDAYDVEQLSRIDGGRKLINAAKSNAQPVRLIEYNFAENTLQSLRILVEEKNEVYVFEKELQMFFTHADNGPLLKEYTIKGTQSMVMKSDLNFSMNGKIVLNP